VLHIMATVQLRNPTQGRAYFDRKKASGKTSMEAMRSLNGDIVYRQLVADAVKPQATGPGGPPGATLQSSAADSHPGIGTSDKPLPGPAKPHPKTRSLTPS
jgi:hypothetical protein